jgi:hypothetical protein
MCIELHSVYRGASRGDPRSADRHEVWQEIHHFLPLSVPLYGVVVSHLLHGLGARVVFTLHLNAIYYPCTAQYSIMFISGAYLFETEPPFAVTHISPEPIIPLPLYSETSQKYIFSILDPTYRSYLF